MRDYQFFLNDDRYSVPTLRLVAAEDDTRARRLADLCLRESPHHLAVEVCENGQVVFTVSRPVPVPHTDAPDLEHRSAEGSATAS
jgi:hypothetical protein